MTPTELALELALEKLADLNLCRADIIASRSGLLLRPIALRIRSARAEVRHARADLIADGYRGEADPLEPVDDDGLCARSWGY